MKKTTKHQALKKISENNSNIIFISTYDDNLGSNQKNKFKCLICNHEWITTTLYVINGISGCPDCGKKKATNTIKHNITSDDFRKKVYKKYEDKITVIGEYISANSRIDAECNICGYKWKPYAKNLISGYGCYNCSCKNKGINMRKTHDIFIEEINKIHNGKISILSEYKTGLDKIEVKCNVCGNEWISNTSRTLLRRGCSKCNFSKGENLISNILNELKINYIEQYTFDELKTEDNGIPIFDFALFDENNNIKKVIEYDGVQHFTAIKKWGGIKRLERQQKIDSFKDNYCIKNNICMIRIPYTDLKIINIKYLKDIIDM